MIWPWRKKKIKLQKGDLRFHTPDGEVWDCDLTLIKLLCEQLERQHKLSEVNGMIEATDMFLENLSSELQSVGCAGCTPTLARQIWIAVADQFGQVERKFRAELRKL